MALKRKITKAEFDALADVLKAEYKANGDGYVLDTDDATDLKTAKDKEAQARKDAEKRLKEAQDALDALQDEKSRTNGDIEALDKSWQAKYDAEKKRADDATAALTTERRNTHAGKVADQIAAKFTVPSLVRKEIMGRLSVEGETDSPIVRVLDKDGKPSALSVEDLTKEFVDNPEYKGIVIGSKATGSAGAAGSAGANASPTFPNNSDKPVDYSKLSAKDMLAHLKATDQEA